MKELEKLSIAQCRKILESYPDAKKYTDEEIEIIRKSLYQLAELDYRIFAQVIAPLIIEDGFLKGQFLTKYEEPD